MTQDAVRAYVEENESQLVAETEHLLSFDTSNPPGETRELAADIEATFERLDIETEQVATDPAKPNLVATLPGASERTLVFNGHLDTVPYDDAAWAHDPLGEREGDRVYGRGATDMKGPLAAMLTATRAFVETDTTPPLTLQFVIVSDEEVAGDAGLPTVLDERGLDADWAVIGETTCAGGRHSVTVADKGSVWVTLTAEGTAAHGSRPMLGTNAIDRLYDAVETIRERFGTERFSLTGDVEAIIDESVTYYEPTMGRETARALFERPTINLGTIEGGEAVNSVPASARARLDIRLTASVETADVLQRLRACVAGCDGIGIEDVSWSVGTYESFESPLVTAVTETAESVTGERVFRRSATGGGDAKKLRHAGIRTVEFALGTDTVHAADEYTTRDALLGNALVYATLPFELRDRTVTSNSDEEQHT